VRRFRLRFLLQEIDLRPGTTVLGRGASCHITIEDPLVSRQHARIRILDDQAMFEDLGSRNGSQINGDPVEDPRVLQDGDRVRIGTMELVFCEAAHPSVETDPARRITGSMVRCAECGNPYPQEVAVCPICGSRRQLDEDTISGVIGSPEGWSLELAVAVMDKARVLQRWDDVDRMLRRARPTVERLIAGGSRVSREHLDTIAAGASSLAAARGEAEWARWVVTIFATLSLVPGPEVVRWLRQLPPAAAQDLAPAAARLVANVQANGGPGRDERQEFAQLESLAAAAPAV